VKSPGAEADLTRWIERLFEHPGLLRMGHNQRAEDLNLGLGWLYYGLARLIHPGNTVVIGSYRGFVPMLLGRAIHDNLEPGEVTFIDPSMVDDFWKDPEAVRSYFRGFGLENVRHYRMTTQQFVETEAYRRMGEIGLLFVDGYHSEEQARFDYRAFEAHLAPRGFALFHDSMVLRQSEIYGADRAYGIRVKIFLDELKRDPGVQLFDVPFGTGVTLLRKTGGTSSEPLLEGLEARP
jgi:predicted O-methyltransferase YrrM